jgi:hypothetical protein
VAKPSNKVALEAELQRIEREMEATDREVTKLSFLAPQVISKFSSFFPAAAHLFVQSRPLLYAEFRAFLAFLLLFIESHRSGCRSPCN